MAALTHGMSVIAPVDATNMAGAMVLLVAAIVPEVATTAVVKEYMNVKTIPLIGGVIKLRTTACAIRLFRGMPISMIGLEKDDSKE